MAWDLIGSFRSRHSWYHWYHHKSVYNTKIHKAKRMLWLGWNRHLRTKCKKASQAARLCSPRPWCGQLGAEHSDYPQRRHYCWRSYSLLPDLKLSALYYVSMIFQWFSMLICQVALRALCTRLCEESTKIKKHVENNHDTSSAAKLRSFDCNAMVSATSSHSTQALQGIVIVIYLLQC